MQTLAFPSYKFRLKNNENKMEIFDIIRKKFVHLTPEEWVRQHTIHYLIHEKKHPKSLINVEKEILLYGIKKRYDIVTYQPNGSIFLMVECKAPHIKITQDVFDQIARYNITLNAKLLMVTNGLEHYFCTINYETKSYHFIKELPLYSKFESL